MAYIGRNPAIGTQKVLDSLESQFNGTLTTFDLRYNTNTIYPTISSALIVSLGGVLQEPGSAYNVASDQITFATAPPAGTDCWILLYSEFGGQAGATPNLTVGNNLAVQGATDLDGDIDIDAGQVTYTASSNIAKFADGAKLIFGDGDDLQIYHTADTESVIHDNGTGPLKIRTNKLQIKSAADSSTIAEFKSGTNGVDLYFDNSKKFETTSTGATVTGTALATALSTGASGTGINISTNTITGPATLTLDPAAVGDNTGTVIIAGNLQVDGTTTTINSTTLTVDDKNIVLASGATNNAAADGAGITIDTANATLLYKATPDAWSFNKSVGIGTDNPAEKLEVYGNARFKAADGSRGIELYPDVGGLGYQRIISYNRTSSAYEDLSIGVNDFIVTTGSTSERLRITSAGNVGIGTNNPSTKLHVNSTITEVLVDATAGDSVLNLRNAGNTNWSGINFTRERSTGTNVTGGSIWMPSVTANNSALLYIQTQSASAGAGIDGALADNNGVRLKLASQPSGVSTDSAFSVEMGSSEKFRITSDGKVRVPDNGKFTAGAGDDLQISHNGSHNILQSINGNISLQVPEGSEIQLAQGGSFEHGVRFIAGGKVELYNNNSKKLETTATGVKVTGALEVTQEYPTIRPILDLNFAATKTLDRRITFTRASVGTYVDELGIIRYTSNNVPRFDHDPTTGESLGLLIEEARTNLITYSQDFTQSVWQNSNNRATCDNTTGIDDPSGGTTASRWSSGTSSSQELIYRQTGTSAGTLTGETCTKSTWIRRVSNNGSVSFFLGDNTGIVVNSQLDSVPVGTWVRCSITRTIVGNAGDTRNYIAVYPGTNGQSTTIDIWGDQFEISDFATSYIPTSGSTATRAADKAKITGTNFTDFHNTTEGTLYGEYKSNSETAPYLVMLSDGTDNNRTIININYDSYQGVVKYNNGTNQAVIDGGTPIANANNKTTLAFKKDDFALSLNGGTVATDTSGDVSVNNMMTIGSRHGIDSFVNSTIKSIKYYNKRLPNAQLQGLTQQ